MNAWQHFVIRRAIVLALFVSFGLWSCIEDKQDNVVAPDTQPPSVAILEPATNAVLSGVVRLKFSATDNVGVTKVECYANEQSLGARLEAPWEFDWDTRGTTTASYTLKAYAYDAANNKGESTGVPVSVKNETSSDFPQKLDELIRSLPLLPEPPEAQKVLLSEKQSDVVGADGGEYTCIEREYDLVNNTSEMLVFNPNTEVIWPGALVQGVTISGGSPAIISIARGPLTITIDLDQAQDPSIIVGNPRYSTVRDAIIGLLEANRNGTNQALFHHKEVRLDSYEQSLIEVDISPLWLGGIKYRENREIWKSSIFVKFVQIYYIIACDPPEPSPVAFLAPSVTVAQLNQYVSPSNPPMYISSVAYGRMLLFRMTSVHSSDKMTAAISARLGNSGLTEEQQKILTESEYEIMVLGGDPVTATTLITGGGINGFISAGATWTPAAPGKPMFYSVKHLSNNHLAKVGFSTHYTANECQVKQQPIRVSFEKIDVHHDCEPDDIVRRAGDFYYEFKANGQIVAELNSRNPVQAHNGETISIIVGKTIFIPKRPNEKVIIFGRVREDDNAGADELPDFTHEYLYKNGKSSVDTTAYRWKSESCDVTVHYQIDFDPPPVLDQ